jgi:hypothetical protein
MENITARGCLKPYVNDLVYGIPKILNIYPAVKIDESPPIINTAGEFTIYSGYSWIYIDGIKLSKDGIFYIMLDKNRGDDKTPSIRQMASGVNVDGETPYGFQ